MGVITGSSVIEEQSIGMYKVYFLKEKSNKNLGS